MNDASDSESSTEELSNESDSYKDDRLTTVHEQEYGRKVNHL